MLEFEGNDEIEMLVASCGMEVHHWRERRRARRDALAQVETVPNEEAAN